MNNHNDNDNYDNNNNNVYYSIFTILCYLSSHMN